MEIAVIEQTHCDGYWSKQTALLLLSNKQHSRDQNAYVEPWTQDSQTW